MYPPLPAELDPAFHKGNAKPIEAEIIGTKVEESKQIEEKDKEIEKLKAEIERLSNELIYTRASNNFPL